MGFVVAENPSINTHKNRGGVFYFRLRRADAGTSPGRTSEGLLKIIETNREREDEEEYRVQEEFHFPEKRTRHSAVMCRHSRARMRVHSLRALTCCIS